MTPNEIGKQLINKIENEESNENIEIINGIKQELLEAISELKENFNEDKKKFNNINEIQDTINQGPMV